MAQKQPPVPPENRPAKGTRPSPRRDEAPAPPEEPENPDQQGQSANTRQNTTLPGSHGHRGR